MSTTRVRILGGLPSPLPHLQRFRAQDPRLGRELELRVAVEAEGSPLHAHFLGELAILSVLDHPSYPPVLDRGAHEGRTYYSVPLRAGRSLTHWIRQDRPALGERVRALHSLASALAAAHARGAALGRLHPALLFWSEERQAVEIPFPLSMRTSQPIRGLPAAPGSEGLSPMQADVVRWGEVAYWTLSGTDEAFDPDSGALLPLTENGADLRPALAFVVEACLAGKDDERPGDGRELDALLESLNLLFDPARSWTPRKDHAALREQVSRTLEEVRARAPEEDPEVVHASLPSLSRVQDLVRPVLDDSLRRWEDLSPRTRRTVVLAAGVLFGVGMAWPWVGPWLRDGVLDGSVVEGQDLTTTRRRERLSRDPYVRGLLRVGEVTPQNFQAAWTRLRNLSLRGRLPEEVDAPGAVDALQALYLQDPAKACERFNDLLVDLEQLVGAADG